MEKVSYLFPQEPPGQPKNREERRINKERGGKKSEVIIETVFNDDFFRKHKIEIPEPEKKEETLYGDISSVYELSVNLSLISDGFENFSIKDNSLNNNKKGSDYIFVVNDKNIETRENNSEINFRTIYSMGSSTILIKPQNEKISAISSIEISFTLPDP